MQIVDTIMGMPVVVAVQTVLTVWRWTSLCCRSDKFQLLVDFLGPCAQAQGRGSHVHRDMTPSIRCIL